jgi:uncharacterized protein YoxC
MQKLPNFNFSSITTVPQALKKIENQVRELAKIVEKVKEFNEDDKAQLVENIDWLKRYYERAEKVIAKHD